ncbi:MAG: hypothetical protein ACHQVK_03785 [Candidatus Paceibacterales bacterium]
MKKNAYHVLRIGLAITFLWIGILIFKNPAAWSTYIQPWALKLIPGSLVNAMLETAVLDMLVGVFLLLNIFTWLAALLGALHLLIVLITCGITDITVRDIGLLCATLALAIEALPTKISLKVFHRSSV